MAIRGKKPAKHFRFFGGKGGVGKTTLAAAAALTAAERGQRVLVVSTDPAHSLGDALGRALGPKARRVATTRGRLDAAELDADAALGRWLADRRGTLREIAERGTYLEGEDIERLLDLSLPGVDELVGLVEVQRLAGAHSYDEVVVDTAPTGHTLRLLATPATLARLAEALGGMLEKHRFLAESLGGRHDPDRCDALVEELARDARSVSALVGDPASTSFAWVLLPEALAVEESRDAVRALEAAGIAVDEAIVNRLLVARAGVRPCHDCASRLRAEHESVTAWSRSFRRLRTRVVAARAREPRGRKALLALGRDLARAPATAARRLPPTPPTRATRAATRAPRRPDGALELTEVLAPRGVRLLFFGGKGGVGKTTTAAAAAIALAEERSARVLLLSADPAHSLGDVLALRLADREKRVPGVKGSLHAREIDAARSLAAELERHRDAVEALFGAEGGAGELGFDREILTGLLDTSPPGLDELLAILSLVDALVDPSKGHTAYDLVVVDTAPTGHALRLLAMPEQAQDWLHAVLAILLKYREVTGLGTLASDLLGSASRLRALRTLLASRDTTRFVVVTRPEALPRLETARLLGSLDELGIAVSALFVNAVPAGACALCREPARAARSEQARLEELGARRRIVTLSAAARSPGPRGVRELRDWARAIATPAGEPAKSPRKATGRRGKRR